MVAKLQAVTWKTLTSLATALNSIPLWGERSVSNGKVWKTIRRWQRPKEENICETGLPGFGPGMQQSKCCALPLGDSPKLRERDHLLPDYFRETPYIALSKKLSRLCTVLRKTRCCRTHISIFRFPHTGYIHSWCLDFSDTYPMPTQHRIFGNNNGFMNLTHSTMWYGIIRIISGNHILYPHKSYSKCNEHCKCKENYSVWCRFLFWSITQSRYC